MDQEIKEALLRNRMRAERARDRLQETIDRFTANKAEAEQEIAKIDRILSRNP